MTHKKKRFLNWLSRWRYPYFGSREQFIILYIFKNPYICSFKKSRDGFFQGISFWKNLKTITLFVPIFLRTNLECMAKQRAVTWLGNYKRSASICNDIGAEKGLKKSVNIYIHYPIWKHSKNKINTIDDIKNRKEGVA